MRHWIKQRDSGFQTKRVLSHTSWRNGKVFWSFGYSIHWKFPARTSLWNFQAGDKLKAMKSLLNSNDTVPKTVGNVLQPPTNGANLGWWVSASTIWRCESAFLVPELNGFIFSFVTPTNGTVMCKGFIKVLSLHSWDGFQFVHRKPVIHGLYALQVEFFCSLPLPIYYEAIFLGPPITPFVETIGSGKNVSCVIRPLRKKILQEKIIFFAGTARQPEIYILAGNYLHLGRCIGVSNVSILDFFWVH